MDRQRIRVEKKDNLFYPGCWVIARIGFYAYDKKFGKGIGKTLKGVQFWKNGDPFGIRQIAGVDEFEELAEEEAEFEPF